MTTSYESLEPMDRDDADTILRGSDADAISLALLRLALHDPDRAAVEDRCIKLAEHPSVWVRRNAATALGHLARLHGALDLNRTIPLLRGLSTDPEVHDWAEDALNDIDLFLGIDSRAA
jgi:uncharacterized protein YaeQ